MRRLLLPFFVMMLALSLLFIVGCGNDVDDVVDDVVDDAGVVKEWAPSRTINIIVPYGPGGSSEPPGRIMAQIMQDDLFDVDVIVTTLPGGDTMIGQSEVLGATPDGHTLLLHHTAMITVHLLGTQPWSFEAYTPVALLQTVPQTLNVKADAPWQTFEELLADLKERPEEISFTWPGATGVSAFHAEWLFAQAGIEGVAKLAATDAAEADMWLMGNHVDVAIHGGIRPLAIGGDFRVLALATEERWDELADVPTYKELGYDVVIGVHLALWAPPNTPQEIIDVLSEAVKYVSEHPDYLQFAKDNLIIPDYKDAADLVRLFTNTTEGLKPVAKIIKGE